MGPGESEDGRRRGRARTYNFEEEIDCNAVDGGYRGAGGGRDGRHVGERDERGG